MTIKNRIAEIFLTIPDHQMYGKVLQVVLEAMESPYGTFAYINEGGDRIVPSMTRDIWDECKMREKSIVFPREKWGDSLWARSIIEKKSISSNGPFKVPDGHMPISRALASPIICKGEAIGNLMVGNKTTDYSEKDKELLERIADRIAPILYSRLLNERYETERKQSEAALRESEEKYRSILENMEEGYYEVDLAGNFTFINDAMCRIRGYARDELIGMNNRQYMNPETAKKVYKLYSEVYRTGRPIKNCQWKIMKRDETEGYVEVSASLVKDLEGKPIGFQGIVQDVTQKKQDEMEKERLQSQLHQSQKMEAVGTLAGGIAHDFNNILAIIMGNAELAFDDVPNGNPVKDYLNEIRLASVRAKDMVQQLLAFSRKSDEENMPLDMAPIIKESMKMLRSAIPTSVEFGQRISGDPCNVMGDAAQINQIVMNLVTNSSDAMSEKGGLLEVTLENVVLREEKPCFNWILSPGAYVRLGMRDTGEGIEPKIMDRIFEPYYTSKEIGKGTGMGLSVVHGIVKRHGGGIRVESELGKGTIFEIYFPALEKTVEEAKEPEEEIKGGSERILFVDDEESMVNLNRQRLERLGYQVKSTTKPLEALEWFKADPGQFDAIITDMTMPRMTGDRLAAEVLKIRPHMPVIICTGYSERMSAKKAEALGVRKYIEKPIDARNLAAVLRDVFEEK